MDTNHGGQACLYFLPLPVSDLKLQCPIPVWTVQVKMLVPGRISEEETWRPGDPMVEGQGALLGVYQMLVESPVGPPHITSSFCANFSHLRNDLNTWVSQIPESWSKCPLLLMPGEGGEGQCGEMSTGSTWKPENQGSCVGLVPVLCMRGEHRVGALGSGRSCVSVECWPRTLLIPYLPLPPRSAHSHLFWVLPTSCSWASVLSKLVTSFLFRSDLGLGVFRNPDTDRSPALLSSWSWGAPFVLLPSADFGHPSLQTFPLGNAL